MRVVIHLQSQVVQVVWRAVRSPTSRRWIGVCDALNLVTEADSLDELHSVIPESIHLLLEDLLSENELDRYLKERGWTAENVPPSPAQAKDVQFDVPWELVAEGAVRDPERRAH